MTLTTFISIAVVALLSYMRSAAAMNAAGDATREAKRQASMVEEGLRAEIDLLRRQVKQLAAGETLTADMIEDGQLWRDVDGAQAKELVDQASNAFVLDVRNPDETASGIVAGAVLIPMDQIEDRRSELPTDGRPILVYCAAGGRSAAVCDHLSRGGVDGLHNLTGGFGAWPGETATPGA